MLMKNNKVQLTVLILILFLSIGLCVGCKKKEEKKEDNKETEVKNVAFNERIVKLVNSDEKDNYLISPYSIEIALNMLKDGAKEDTYKQIEEVIGSREIPVFTSKDRISVTNGAFIKDDFKEFVEKDYYDKLDNYKAELIFDKFTTPDAINNWVNEHTYGMIPKILDDINPDFVMGIANAVAIDVEWQTQWKCENTDKHEFTKTDGTKMDTEMMFANYTNGKNLYFEIDGAKGVVLPYSKYSVDGEKVYDEEGIQLEYVAIRPEGTVDEFINNLKDNQLKEIVPNVDGKYELNVSLPRYGYDYKLENFMDILQKMGIKDAFDKNNANFEGIATKENLRKHNPEAYNLYVEDAIHQTHIDLNEKGTKAAAVTYFGLNEATSAYDPNPPVVKEIVFDKPFVYMIRDSKTKEILFFGVVEKPNEWKGSTCSE